MAGRCTIDDVNAYKHHYMICYSQLVEYSFSNAVSHKTNGTYVICTAHLKYIYVINLTYLLFPQTLSPVSVFTSGSGVATDFIGILPAFFKVVYTSFSQPARLPHALYACLFNRGKGMSTVFGLLSAAAVSVLVREYVCVGCFRLLCVVWRLLCQYV
jgi:hypothetical protein